MAGPLEKFRTGTANVDNLASDWVPNLVNFLSAAETAGYTIRIYSGFRSFEHQARIYKSAPKGAAAPPGGSYHGPKQKEFGNSLGHAVDLSAKGVPLGRSENTAATNWAHANAAKHGLKFPLLQASYVEKWHCEPAYTRGGKVPTGAGKIVATPTTSSRAASTANTQRERFVATVAPAANALAKRTGIDADFFIVHWSVETGDGASSGFLRRKNPGNIVGPGPSPIQFTLDTVNSFGYRFRIYRTFEDGAADYLSLLERRYASVITAGKKSIKEGFDALALSPWDAGHYSGEQIAVNGRWSGRNAGKVLFARYASLRGELAQFGDLSENDEFENGGDVDPTIFGTFAFGDIDVSVAKLQNFLGLPAHGKFDQKTFDTLKAELLARGRSDYTVELNGTTAGTLGFAWKP